MVANGIEISAERFQKIRKLSTFRNVKHLKENSQYENSENLGIVREVVPFSGNFRKCKPEFFGQMECAQYLSLRFSEFLLLILLVYRL